MEVFSGFSKVFVGLSLVFDGFSRFSDANQRGAKNPGLGGAKDLFCTISSGDVVLRYIPGFMDGIIGGFSGTASRQPQQR